MKTIIIISLAVIGIITALCWIIYSRKKEK